MENTIFTIEKKGFKRKRVSFKTPLKRAEFFKDVDLFVILTVPHSECIEGDDHNCDIVALKNAKSLSKFLNKAEIQNKVFIGDINRFTSDLNREESRNTEFHREIDNLIESIRGEYNMILLDIHSGDFGEYPLVILKLKSFSELELLNLIQNETNALVMLGDEMNYISRKAQEQGIPALLLELNESLKYGKSFYRKIVRAISLWYRKFFVE